MYKANIHKNMQSGYSMCVIRNRPSGHEVLWTI